MITGQITTEDDVVHNQAVAVIHPINMVLETEHPFIVFDIQVFHTVNSLQKNSKPILSKKYKIEGVVYDSLIESAPKTGKEFSNYIIGTFYNMIVASDETFNGWTVYETEEVEKVPNDADVE